MNNRNSYEEYLLRIQKVQDYIDSNLSNKFELEKLASIAGFSKYHFHRIFYAMTNETPVQYATRIKMGRAAISLVYNPHVNITDLAYSFGFSDTAVFSRAFKNYYGLSPKQYKIQHSNKSNAPFNNLQYNGDIEKKRRYIMKVEAKSVEKVEVDMQVVYLRHTGSYEEFAKVVPVMMKKLYDFAISKNLLQFEDQKVLTIYHDNPEITSDSQLRTSVCISIPKGLKIETTEEIGVMDISGNYGVGHFEVLENEYQAAWQYMYGEWLPNSNYQPRDALPFEVYVSNPHENVGSKQLLDIYLPIEAFERS